MNDFEKALAYEKGRMRVADEFYKKVFHPTTITRHDWNSNLGREKQINDVDCTLSISAPTIGFYDIDISEKFRSEDWGDMCIEIWSDFENKKPGWALKCFDENGPDAYLYVAGDNKYFFWNHSEFKELIRKLKERLTEDNVRNLFTRERNPFRDKRYWLEVDGMNMIIIRKWTDKKYFGICVCIDWKDLRDKYFIDFRKYNLDNDEQ